MGARFAGEDAAAARAAALRDAGLRLAEADAAGYAPVLEACACPRASPGARRACARRCGEPPTCRSRSPRRRPRSPRSRAGSPREGRPALRGDALTGAELAAARARAAARLVAIDLEHAPEDPRLARAQAAAERAAG